MNSKSTYDDVDRLCDQITATVNRFQWERERAWSTRSAANTNKADVDRTHEGPESAGLAVRGDGPRPTLSDLSPGEAGRVPPCGAGTPSDDAPSTSAPSIWHQRNPCAVETREFLRGYEAALKDEAARTAQDGARGDAVTMERGEASQNPGSSDGRAPQQASALVGRGESQAQVLEVAGSSPAQPASPPSPTRDPALPTRDEWIDRIRRLHKTVQMSEGSQKVLGTFAPHLADFILEAVSPALSAMRAERDALKLRLDQYLGWKPEDLADQISDAVKARAERDAAKEEAAGWRREVAYCVRDLGFPGSSEKPHVLATRVRSERDAFRQQMETERTHLGEKCKLLEVVRVELQKSEKRCRDLEASALASAKAAPVGVTPAIVSAVDYAAGAPYPGRETIDLALDEIAKLDSATHALVEVGELEALRKGRDDLRDDAFALRNLIDGTIYEPRPRMYRTNARGEHLCITAEKADLQQLDDGRILHVAAPSAGDVEACAKEFSAATRKLSRDKNWLTAAEATDILRRYWPHPSRTPVVTAEDVQAAYTAAVGFRCDDSFAARFAVRLTARLSPPAAAEKTEQT